MASSKRETLSILAKRLEDAEGGAKRVTNTETLRHVRVTKGQICFFVFIDHCTIFKARHKFWSI